MDERHFERGAENATDVAGCAATGCGSRSLTVKELDPDTGQLAAGAPHGWGVIEAHQPDGTVLVLFVCSRRCEKRLAQGLSTPILGELG
jgi:hypothetical protein